MLKPVIFFRYNDSVIQAFSILITGTNIEFLPAKNCTCILPAPNYCVAKNPAAGDVLQHGISGAAANILRMAGKSLVKPDVKQPHAIHSFHALCLSVDIEVSCYEQKTFWSLCSYMVRSHKRIEMLVNLINIAYCAMKLLPYQDRAFAKYRTESVQEFRFALIEQIRQ